MRQRALPQKVRTHTAALAISIPQEVGLKEMFDESAGQMDDVVIRSDSRVPLLKQFDAFFQVAPPDH